MSLKIPIPVVVLVTVLLMVCLGLTVAGGNLVGKAPKPTAETTVIVLKDRHWVLEELNDAVYTEVSRSAGMPLSSNLQVSVRITPQDTNSMCQFVYSQGFDRFYWRVVVGYDGKVKSVAKSLRREGD
jgi:hypothetical protein